MLNASLLHVESLHPISGKLEKVQKPIKLASAWDSGSSSLPHRL